MPVLLYRLDVCTLTKRNFQSLEFTVNRGLMKLLKTSNVEIINECRNFFGIELLVKRFDKFCVMQIS